MSDGLIHEALLSRGCNYHRSQLSYVEFLRIVSLIEHCTLIICYSLLPASSQRNNLATKCIVREWIDRYLIPLATSVKTNGLATESEYEILPEMSIAHATIWLDKRRTGRRPRRAARRQQRRAAEERKIKRKNNLDGKPMMTSCSQAKMIGISCCCSLEEKIPSEY